ncbi:hypothetical protein AVEN_10490-1 [Araneus ventricosus]|uniref:Uncharacterized protein n=1 Tax=Araneus ventricosus TaxID=182803 RepID=A0A4Y2H747_ARAVE|nr:hypothetical protein AVEN_245730-1 [Araneus ventricosus]GBM60652.1 hypothetical protein AVEN_10490-1 [Araneus ventricosus]
MPLKAATQEQAIRMEFGMWSFVGFYHIFEEILKIVCPSARVHVNTITQKLDEPDSGNLARGHVTKIVYLRKILASIGRKKRIQEAPNATECVSTPESRREKSHIGSFTFNSK